MVGLFKAFLPPLLLAAFAAAQDFQILSPSGSIWWVAESENQISWDCKNPQAITDSNFTVLLKGPSFAAPQAIIAIEKNEDCIKTITKDQANQPSGNGYTIYLADPLNNTHVFATSEQFEIQPLGSKYPSQVSSSASAASGTATASSSSASSSSAATLSSHSPSFLGLTGIMGLLTFGLLGA